MSPDRSPPSPHHRAHSGGPAHRHPARPAGPLHSLLRTRFPIPSRGDPTHRASPAGQGALRAGRRHRCPCQTAGHGEWKGPLWQGWGPGCLAGTREPVVPHAGAGPAHRRPLSAGAWDVQRLRSSSPSLCCGEKPGGRQGQASETKALPWLPARKPTLAGEGRV